MALESHAMQGEGNPKGDVRCGARPPQGKAKRPCAREAGIMNAG